MSNYNGGSMADGGGRYNDNDSMGNDSNKYTMQ
jgi:hypothetical protein